MARWVMTDVSGVDLAEVVAFSPDVGGKLVLMLRGGHQMEIDEPFAGAMLERIQNMTSVELLREVKKSEDDE